ncbi:MAG: type I pullulanase [Prevotella sp.]|nr:type I pullulanase [Prevotella sp.]
MNIKSILMAGIFSFVFAQQGLKAQTPVTFNEADYSPNVTKFQLFAPDNAKSVKLRIYNDAATVKAWKTVKMKKTGKETFTTEVKGDLKGKFYTFDTGHGETPGVFATAVGVNGKRAAIIDLRETDPEGWDDEWNNVSTKQPCDRIIYELHHRDFSIDISSGLENKGKFLALTEPKAINYLKKLGVNTIHILPSFDFASVDETKIDTPQYNWGYDPLNYNVPEGSYSTDPYNPMARIREFKEMVEALHKADIDVVLDVVYNHTNDIEGSNFQRTYPDYFYRKTADGKYSDGSGCGNETASDMPGMRDFMIKSMSYWMSEYHIDGFRVDLMGVHDIQTMNDIHAALLNKFGKAFIYGEGWSAGTCAYPVEKLAMKANTKQLDGIAAFCDDMRDALRGPFNDDHEGAFLAGIPGEEESLKFGIVGAISHPQVDMTKVNYSKEAWANEPSQMIAYVSCHDDMCLTDRLRASIHHITEGEIIRLDLLAQTAVLTSQGIPFILSGEEMLRDKKGVHNSYNSPDSINHLDWTNLEKYPQVFDYYSKLISLRKNHPAFRLGSAEKVREHLEFLPVKDNLVAFCLKDNAGGDVWNDIIVILNSARQPQTVDVPEGKYTVVCRNILIDENGIDTVEGPIVTVPAQSAMIIHN